MRFGQAVIDRLRGKKTRSVSRNAYAEDHKSHLLTKEISANAVISIFKQYYSPTSVIDLGCGVGAWLKVWKENGAQTIKGLDLYASQSGALLIQPHEFEQIDLNSYRHDSANKYDLAMSLEVAEHLTPKSSERFVEVLTTLSDCILFSAAIPFQSGTEHINCQPIQFWVDLFNKKGFDCFDCIRASAMKNEKIEWWYAQNILVFARGMEAEALLKQGLQVDNNPMFFYHSEHVKLLLGK